MEIQNVVYKIVNTQTNDVYVGSTKRGLVWRTRKHLRELDRKIHHNRHLQNAYNKYGKDSFVFSVLELVEDSELLTECEQKWINKLNPTYNVMRDIKSHIGCKRSEETKAKISESLKNRPLSDAHKNSIRKTMLGSKHTEDRKRKIGEAHKIPIVQLDMKNTPVAEWPSIKDAAIALGFNKAKISNCVCGRKKSYKGFIWIKK